MNSVPSRLQRTEWEQAGGASVVGGLAQSPTLCAAVSGAAVALVEH